MLQETIPGTRVVGQRWAMAEAQGIATLQEIAGLTDSEAATAWQVYCHIGVARSDMIMGVPEWKHGAFLEADMIKRAVEHSAELLAARGKTWRRRR